MDPFFGFQENEKYGLRKGMVFYFADEMTANTIAAVETILQQFLQMTQQEFTKKHSGRSDYVNVRNLRGGWQKIFHREFDGRDRNNAEVLVLDSCTPQKLQPIRAVIVFRNCEPWLNDLYLQFPLSVSWADVSCFVAGVNQTLRLQYASAGYEMASNILYYPGSLGYATRALENLPYVNSEVSEWNAFMAHLGIPCPNFLQVLGPALHTQLQPDSIPGIYTELMGDRMLLDLFDHIGDTISEPPKEELEARFSRLYQLFQPILVSYPRPVFLKKDLWEKRLARFHTTTII